MSKSESLVRAILLTQSCLTIQAGSPLPTSDHKGENINPTIFTQSYSPTPAAIMFIELNNSSNIGDNSTSSDSSLGDGPNGLDHINVVSPLSRRIGGSANSISDSEDANSSSSDANSPQAHVRRLSNHVPPSHQTGSPLGRRSQTPESLSDTLHDSKERVRDFSHTLVYRLIEEAYAPDYDPVKNISLSRVFHPLSRGRFYDDSVLTDLRILRGDDDEGLNSILEWFGVGTEIGRAALSILLAQQRTLNEILFFQRFYRICQRHAHTIRHGIGSRIRRLTQDQGQQFTAEQVLWPFLMAGFREAAEINDQLKHIIFDQRHTSTTLYSVLFATSENDYVHGLHFAPLDKIPFPHNVIAKVAHLMGGNSLSEHDKTILMTTMKSIIQPLQFFFNSVAFMHETLASEDIVLKFHREIDGFEELLDFSLLPAETREVIKEIQGLNWDNVHVGDFGAMIRLYRKLYYCIDDIAYLYQIVGFFDAFISIASMYIDRTHGQDFQHITLSTFMTTENGQAIETAYNPNNRVAFRGLWFPILRPHFDEPVMEYCKDFLSNNQTIAIITAPNQYGKSSFDRAFGAACVLSHAIGIAPASYFRSPYFSDMRTLLMRAGSLNDVAEGRYLREIGALNTLIMSFLRAPSEGIKLVIIDEPLTGSGPEIIDEALVRLLNALNDLNGSFICILSTFHKYVARTIPETDTLVHYHLGQHYFLNRGINSTENSNETDDGLNEFERLLQ